MAHHADDQSETVLKRIFEGATLPKLKGLLPKTVMKDVTLYRPLLMVSKQQILAYLQEKSLSFFVDKTNEDSRFLRSRMRSALLPELSNIFGKNIGSSLAKIAEYSHELDCFLEEEIAPYLANICETSEGLTLDLSEARPSKEFIMKALLRSFFAKARICLPASVINAVFDHIEKNSHDKSLLAQKHRIKIAHRRVTISQLEKESKKSYDNPLIITI